MNRREVVEEIEKGAGFSAPLVDAVLGYFFWVVAREVAKGKRIELRGFGAFRAVARSARRGRHPKTGAMISKPATTTPVFTAALPFRAHVSGSARYGKGMTEPVRLLSIEK